MNRCPLHSVETPTVGGYLEKRFCNPCFRDLGPALAIDYCCSLAADKVKDLAWKFCEGPSKFLGEGQGGRELPPTLGAASAAQSAQAQCRKGGQKRVTSHGFCLGTQAERNGRRLAAALLDALGSGWEECRSSCKQWRAR